MDDINHTWRKSSKQCNILLLLSIQLHFRTPINLPNDALSENPQHALNCKSPDSPVQSEYYGTFYTTTVPHNHTRGIFHCITDRSPFSSRVFEAARLCACTKMAANPAALLQLMSPPPSPFCQLCFCIQNLPFHLLLPSLYPANRTHPQTGRKSFMSWYGILCKPFSPRAPRPDRSLRVNHLLSCGSDKAMFSRVSRVS